MPSRTARAGLVLQHGDTGPPDLLEAWLRSRGIAFEVAPVWRDGVPDDVDGRSFVASLGSQWSPAPGSGAPDWVAREVDFLARAVSADVPVLGLCFGGQALAAAMGADVRRAARGEGGWLEVSSSDPALIPRGPWLQFHWDVFDVPAGAAEVARSAAGPAAFVAGPHLRLLFHPATMPEVADAWAQVERERLAALGTTPERLRTQGRAVAAAAREAAFTLFDRWWAR